MILPLYYIAFFSLLFDLLAEVIAINPNSNNTFIALGTTVFINDSVSFQKVATTKSSVFYSPIFSLYDDFSLIYLCF